jgi:hypothetical protein
MAISIINGLVKISEALQSLKNKKLDTRVFNAVIHNTYTVVPASEIKYSSGFSSNGGNVILMGNLIRPYIYPKVTTALGTGNIADKQICTFTIDDDRITYIPPTFPMMTASTGGVIHGLFRTSSTSSPWSCSVDITYTHADVAKDSTFALMAAIPVSIDVTKY